MATALERRLLALEATVKSRSQPIRWVSWRPSHPDHQMVSAKAGSLLWQRRHQESVSAFKKRVATDLTTQSSRTRLIWAFHGQWGN